MPAFAHFAGSEAELKFEAGNTKVPAKPFGRELEAQPSSSGLSQCCAFRGQK